VQVRVGGSGIDPAHPPGVFGLRLLPGAPGQGATGRPVTADLAIGDTYLIPGRVRDSQIGLVPFVEVKNLGDDIPAPLVGQIKVYTAYFIGQYGDSLHDAQEAVWCVNGLDHSGPFKAGESVFVTPTHPQKLPAGVFTTWTKLLGARTFVWVPPNGPIVDPNLANNRHDEYDNPPRVLGDGPGPYEVILYEGQNFQGGSKSFEYSPKLRQKLVPDLGDWNRRARSYRVGGKVVWAAFTQPNFVDWDRSDYGYLSRHVMLHGPAESWEFVDSAACWTTRSLDRAVCSLIIYPVEQMYPKGVLLVDTSVWEWDTVGFFPLPEDPNAFDVDVPDLGPLSTCADRLQAFGGFSSVLLYVGPNFQEPHWPFVARAGPNIVGIQEVGFDFGLDVFGWDDRAASMRIGAVNVSGDFPGLWLPLAQMRPTQGTGGD
jgi:hypothetical protein